jgi:hypothetical protein
MRLLLLGLLVLVGCGDDASSQDMTLVVDLAKPAPDLSATPSTCYQVTSCVQGCAGMMSCITACTAKGSPEAMTKYAALVECALTACGSATDAGAAKCAAATDVSMACRMCVGAAVQDQTVCGPALNACLAQ